MKKKTFELCLFFLWGARLARNDGASEANIGNSGPVLPTKKNGRGVLRTASVQLSHSNALSFDSWFYSNPSSVLDQNSHKQLIDLTYIFTHTPYQKWITMSNSSTIFTQMQVYKRHKLPYNCILEQECEFIWSIKSIVKRAMLLLCHSTARLLYKYS